MNIQVSVVIGTYDRAHLLEGALQALAAQEVPDSLKWEIVVVDNNSADATAQTVAAFSKTTPIPVRYVFERQQGVASARNRGVREARGEIIAFTDDDVLPTSDWVAQTAAAIVRWNADGAGGRILPKWEATPPRWLTENWNLMARLAIMDFETGQLLSLPIGPKPQVWGANMAFRREALQKVGDFDPRLGVVGKKLYRGEEDDLIRRALRLGLKIAYDPALRVFHRIGPDRAKSVLPEVVLRRRRRPGAGDPARRRGLPLRRAAAPLPAPPERRQMARSCAARAADGPRATDGLFLVGGTPHGATGKGELSASGRPRGETAAVCLTFDPVAVAPGQLVAAVPCGAPG